MKRLFFFLLIFLITSCDKKYVSNIPSFPVSMELDLTFEDKDLVGSLTYKTFTKEDIAKRTGIYSVGYGGVLVYHGIDQFYAYDLSCPHEASRTIHIKVEEDGLNATCPKCNSRFDLDSGVGFPVSGPANEENFHLKSYKVNKNGNKVYIWN